MGAGWRIAIEPRLCHSLVLLVHNASSMVHSKKSVVFSMNHEQLKFLQYKSATQRCIMHIPVKGSSPSPSQFLMYERLLEPAVYTTQA